MDVCLTSSGEVERFGTPGVSERCPQDCYLTAILGEVDRRSGLDVWLGDMTINTVARDQGERCLCGCASLGSIAGLNAAGPNAAYGPVRPRGH